MELNEYQRRAMTTCMPSSENFTYMFLNLVGEVGEFASKVAKGIRKGHCSIGLEPNIVDAYDIANETTANELWQFFGMEERLEELKKEGLWFVCADMDGEVMYRQNLTGPIGLVIGNEGEGVSRLVKEHCDFHTAIPMHGEIDSLNASVAAGVLMYEIVRQRLGK